MSFKFSTQIDPYVSDIENRQTEIGNIHCKTIQQLYNNANLNWLFRVNGKIFQMSIDMSLWLWVLLFGNHNCLFSCHRIRKVASTA